MKFSQELDQTIVDSDVVVIVNMLNVNFIKHVEKVCQEHSCRYILLSNLQTHCLAYFGLQKVYTHKRFNQTNKHEIRAITNSDPGVITLADHHKFRHGDYIEILGLRK